MSKLHFNLPGDLRLALVSDSELRLSPRDLLVLSAYVPGIRIDENVGEPDFTIEHQESPMRSFSQTDTRCVVRGPWNGVFPDDLFHLVYGAARRLFLLQRLYPVHSACVGTDEQVLILGHSGAGKTSLVRELITNHGMHMLSGNKTLVKFSADTLSAVGGTSAISVRKSDEPFWSEYMNNEIEIWDRYMFDLQKQFQEPVPRRIKAIVTVRLNDSVEIQSRLDSLGALHALHPYFLDLINADVVLDGGDAVFTGTVDAEVSRELARSLAHVCRSVPVYSLVGSRPFIAEVVASL